MTRSPDRRRAALAALLLAVLLAGCARGTKVEASGGSGSSGASIVNPATGGAPPTLPPAQTRDPDRFDPQGCQVVSATQVDCTQTAAQLDARAAGATPSDWRTLAGFVGKYWTNDVSRGAVTVVDASVTVGTDATGHWHAVGLVRNEQASAVSAASATATLYDGNGKVLETVEATSPVRSIRSGEPAPFEVVSKTAAATVAKVTWSAQAAMPADAAPADPTSRDLALNTYWSRSYGDANPIDMYLHHDDPATPHGYLLFGSANDVGRALSAPTVTVAWLDTDGRVLLVRQVPLADAHANPVDLVAPGAARDFMVTIDDPIDGERAGRGGPMLWGAGR